MTQLHTNSTRVAESPSTAPASAGTLPGATGEAQLVTRRGRQRMPTPWLMGVMCRLGMHEGQWAYVAKGNCTQGRECERCGSVHVSTNHEWSESWEIETRWWQGDKEGHRCLQCGEVEEWTVNNCD